MKIFLILLLLKKYFGLNLEDLYLDQKLDIYDLNESTLSRFIEKHTHTFVLFYEHNEPKSKRMLLEFERASKQAHKLGITYGRIDISFNPEVPKEWKLTDLPIVYWINTKDNEREPVYTYNYIGYAKKKFNMSSVEEVSDLKHQRKGNMTSNYLMIGLPEDLSPDMDDYMKKISMLDSVTQRVGYNYIYMTHSPEVKKFYNMTKPFSIVSNRWDMMSISYDREEVNYKKRDFKNDDNLIKLLELYIEPGYQKFNKELLLSMQEGKPMMLLIHKKMSELEIEKAEFMMSQLAKTYRRYMLFSMTDLNNQGGEMLKNLYNIRDEHLPYLLITNARKNNTIEMDKFKLENVKLDMKEFEEFIDNWRKKKLQSFLISQDADDKPDSRGVYKIVSKNFEKFLSQKDKDIVLLVCSNITKYCPKFDERYERILKRLDGNQIVFGETDPNQNEYEVEIIQNFPNIFFFPAENSKINYKKRFEESLIYEGDFTSKNVTDWIVKSSKIGLKVKPLENEMEINLAEANDTILSSASDFNLDEVMKFDMPGGEDGDFDLEKILSMGEQLGEEIAMKKKKEEPLHHEL
jgi:hypothetical protein